MTGEDIHRLRGPSKLAWQRCAGVVEQYDYFYPFTPPPDESRQAGVESRVLPRFPLHIFGQVKLCSFSPSKLPRKPEVEPG